MDTLQIFLQEKIKNLGSAIFFNQSDAVLKLPTSIVRIMDVDEYGFIWFYIQKPPQQLTEFEKEFPVKLDFFRKGLDYSLQVIGNGFIVNDPEELMIITTNHEEIRQFDPGKMILIKVKMTRADYFDNISGSKSSWLHNALSALQSWIFPNAQGYGPVTYFPKISEVS
ncbi:MAG TPA: hypothetical protein VK588_15500 [Chitinophagaceae bacterium]|nr:hypothetical protein [Chitinophagaceae bacterium]